MSARRVAAAGLAVVLAAAAVLSFDALRGLALAVAIPAYLAPLLPVAVDAGAAVSCAVWLGVRTSAEVARFAARMTWALLAVTVAGNAAQLGMHAHGIAPPWWVAVLVGTIAPAVAGSTVHLLVLLVRGDSPGGLDTGTKSVPVVAGAVNDRSADGAGEDRAGELIAAGAGRRRIARELGVTEYEARALLTRSRNGAGGGRDE